ncbi:MAG: DUF4139 domain-containing protein [Desulfovibrio sp.]|jgi:hypothetical protein|nr:DUF4139 domain-containing protein [Desulfovibrio sp.]
MFLHNKGKPCCLAALACLCFSQVVAVSASDIGAAPAQPKTVVLSPDAGRFFVEERGKVVAKDGVSLVVFDIPNGADGLRIEIPGQQAAHWTSAALRRDAGGEAARSREALLAEKARLIGQREAARARTALWKHIPEQGIPVQDLESHGTRMTEAIVASVADEARIQGDLEALEQVLALLPESSPVWRRVTVTLRKSVSGVDDLPVHYSYTLHNCGWRPVYAFDAISEKDEIAVRLLAEIRQFTGMDWSDVKLVLASRGPGMLEPASLPRWEVGSSAGLAPQQTRLQRPPPADARPKPARMAAPANMPAQADASGAYASWSLATRALPEGVSRLVIDEDVWKTPLRWLARPLQGDSRVWLTAKCAPRGNKIWPSGGAEYNVDGQFLGQGVFRPQGGSADLFFGADPRVSVVTTADDKKRGESGFIGKNRTWFWSWTFTLHNDHDRPVNVRLEHPEPLIVEQSVEVKYQDSLPAKRDEKNHALFWDIAVPAKGKANLSHAITITAPKDLPLSPVAP